MNSTLEAVLGDIDTLAAEVPGARPEYVDQLKRYLRALAGEDEHKQQEYQGWYAAVTQTALKKALERGELDDLAKLQLKYAFRVMDEHHGVITILPIVEEEIPGAVVTEDGRVVRPYLVLPNNERIPLYSESPLKSNNI